MCGRSSNYRITNKCNIIADLIKICIIFIIFVGNFAFFIPMNNKCVVYASGESEVEKELSQTVDDILKDIDFESLESLIDESFEV